MNDTKRNQRCFDWDITRIWLFFFLLKFFFFLKKKKKKKEKKKVTCDPVEFEVNF